MSDAPAATRLEWAVTFDAPVARVFAAITEARHLEAWFCDRAETTPGLGGRIVLRWTRDGGSGEPYVGRWIAWEPGQSCAFEGGHSGYPDGDAGRVSCQLTDLDSGTRLEVRHDFPVRPEYQPIVERYRDAWPRALARLTHYLSPEDR